MATNDGLLGTTSTGQSEISLVKGDGIRISDVDNGSFNAATQDTYVDTLTLTVEPD